MFAESARKSLKSGKKFRAEMISRPQNDLRHTGHIGELGGQGGNVRSVCCVVPQKFWHDLSFLKLAASLFQQDRFVLLSGYDGAMFGDVSFIGDQYDKLPVKVVNPCKSPLFSPFLSANLYIHSC